MLEDLLRRTERDAKVGRLKAVQVKMLRLLASRGDARAQKLLDKLSSAKESKDNLPLPSARTHKSFRRAERAAGNSAKTVAPRCPQNADALVQSRNLRKSNDAITRSIPT